MDIRSAYSAALSSLSVTQYESAVTSTNIANANVEGYSALRVNTASTFSAGEATGVTIASVSSYVDENLYKSYVSAISDTQETATQAEYLSQLLDQFGTVDSDNALSDLIVDLENALSDLSVTPESQSIKNTVLSAADILADSLNDLSNEVQSARSSADKDIETAVNDVNDALETIDELNKEIATKTALGEDTSTLEDARNLALQTVSENMDVTYFTTGTNELHVYTKSGQPLVDSHAHELQYDATNNVSSTTNFDSITLDGKDITNSIKSGKISALVELRDDTLVAKQEELDELASALIDTINAVYNTGTPSPAQNTITGQDSFNGTDSFSATGTMRLAILDEDGNAQNVTDLDLSTYSTVDELVTGLNAISGVSASLNSDGKLVISSDDANYGIAISEMNSAVGTNEQGVSDYFGLNDFFTGSDAGSISIRSDLLENPSLMSTGMLSKETTLTVGDNALSSGDASMIMDLQEAFSTEISFDDAGNLDGGNMTFGNYASEILSDLAVRADKAEMKAETQQLISEALALDISNQSGVNLDEEAARLTVLENQYSASAQVIQTLDDMFTTLINAVS